MTGALREDIQAAMADGSYDRAATLLGELLRGQPTAATASYVVSRFLELRSHLRLVKHRLAIVRSFTVEPLIPLLRARCFAAGIDATVQVGSFNLYAGELLDAQSPLYEFEPEIVILAVRTADVVPALWYESADLTEPGLERAVEAALADFTRWIEAFRRRSGAHLVLHNLEVPAHLAHGVWESQRAVGQKEAIGRLNQGLRELARRHRGVHVLDYDGLVARHGRLRWHDEGKWLAMRLPITADCLIHLADEYMRFIHPLTGRVRKALVVDLDNTLWGGMVGEDGLAGLQLGLEYPGAAFRACQRALLDLHRRGIILAICSKNDPADALEVIEAHPDMVLRRQHFAAVRINWKDKVENMRAIAAELNLGLDALAFLDDSPTEREWMRTALPEVHVIDLPADPMLYAGAVRECPVFERVGLSEEDTRRGEYYSAQQERADLEQAAGSREEFYHSLGMRAEIAAATPLTLPRIAQLTQKTNQFNLTGRRYTEQELLRLMDDPQTCILSLRLADRFGDSGIVGVAIARVDRALWEIDTFLLSCRAIGRGVETALLATLATKARQAGGERLSGWYLATRRNGPAADFYPKHGFTRATVREGDSEWTFNLTRGTLAVPSWIACRTRQEDQLACKSG